MSSEWLWEEGGGLTAVIFAWASSVVIAWLGSAQRGKRLWCGLPVTPEMPGNPCEQGPQNQALYHQQTRSTLGFPDSERWDKPRGWVISSLFSPASQRMSNSFVHMSLHHEIKICCSKASGLTAADLHFMTWWIYWWCDDDLYVMMWNHQWFNWWSCPLLLWNGSELEQVLTWQIAQCLFPASPILTCPLLREAAWLWWSLWKQQMWACSTPCIPVLSLPLKSDKVLISKGTCSKTENSTKSYYSLLKFIYFSSVSV